MTTFINDLGKALETAFKAADFTGVLGKTGANTHVQYADQPTQWPKGATGRLNIRTDGFDPIEEYETSARSVFRFLCEFEFKDVRGKRQVLGKALAICRNVLANHGAAVLNTHFTDTGSKRLGGSGAITFAPLVAEADTLADIDEPTALITVSIDITHGVPL